jgi:hypothetical protein
VMPHTGGEPVAVRIPEPRGTRRCAAASMRISCLNPQRRYCSTRITIRIRLCQTRIRELRTFGCRGQLEHRNNFRLQHKVRKCIKFLTAPCIAIFPVRNLKVIVLGISNILFSTLTSSDKEICNSALAK